MYGAGLWKKNLLTWIFGRGWYPILTFKCPAPESLLKWHHQFGRPIAFIFLGGPFTAILYKLSTNGIEGEIAPLLWTTSIMQLFFKMRRHREFGCIFEAGEMLSLLSVHQAYNCTFSNHWTLKRSQLCPIEQEYSSHVIVITGNNFIPVLISVLLRI